MDDLLDYAPSKFTIILMADVLWNAFSHPLLLMSLLSLLAPIPTSRIHIISGLHTGRAPLARFLRLAAFKGLVPDEGGTWEREVTGAERAWDEEREDGDIKDRNRWTLEVRLRFDDETLKAMGYQA